MKSSSAIVVDIFVVEDVTSVLHNRRDWMLLFAVPNPEKSTSIPKKELLYLV